jgi:non-heme chloroperoxidase
MKPESQAKKIIASDGVEIFYWVNYNKHLFRNFVFLHPASSMNSSSLEDLEKRLNSLGHKTIVLDPRGTGLSQAPAKSKYFKIENYADDIARIVQAEHLQDITFFGHSAGFMPIVQYVSNTGNAYSIVGTGVSNNFPATIGTSPVKTVLFHLFDKIGRYIEYPASLGVKLFNPLQGRLQHDQSRMTGYSEGAIFEAIVNAPYSQIHQNIVSGRQINKWDITEQLRDIRVPTILIYGNQDKVIPKETGEHIKSLMTSNPHVYVENIDGRLSMPVTSPDKVIEVMKKYKNIEKKR